MKHITLLALVVITANVATAQTVFPDLIGQANYEQTSATTFLPVDSVTYTYTGNHTGDLTHPLDYTKQHNYAYVGVAWDSLETLVFQTFNSNDLVDSQITEEWEIDKFVNSIDYLIYYDANNNDTSFIVQNWDSVGETGYNWVNSNKYVLGWDTYGNQISSESYFYSDSTWDAQSLVTFSYDLHNNLINETIAEWKGSKWDTTSAQQSSYFYNNKGEDSLEIDISFNFNTYKWDTTDRYFTAYQANTTNDSVQVLQGWNVSAPHWTNIDSTTYGYDKNNNNTSILTQRWDTAHWGNYTQELFTYNTYSQTTSDILDYDNGPWQPPFTGYEYFYYYAFPTGINPRLNDNSVGQELSVYPNPTSSYFHANIILPQPTRLQLSLVNVLGQTIWSADEGNVSQFNGNISVNNLPGGVYLLQMKTGVGVQSKEVVVSK